MDPTPAPNESLGPTDPPFEGHDQPFPQQQVPQTTKPSQLPEGASPMPSMPMMPAGMSMSTAMPSSPQFDPGSLSTDPVGARVNAVATLVQRQNPEMDQETVRRVARKVVGRLVTSDWGWHPHWQEIEDPLHHRRIKEMPHGHEEEEPHRPKTPVSEQPDPEEEWERRMNQEEDGEERRSTEEPVDLSEFDRPGTSLPTPPSGDRKVWPPEEEGPSVHRGSVRTADWGWSPMEQNTEIPDQDKDKSDDGGGGGSSLPKMPGMPKLPGMGGGGGAAAGGAGEAAGGAAVAEEALPLLLL